MKTYFIVASDPNFLGGVSLYVNNLIISQKINKKIYWVYKGGKNRLYNKNNVNYIEIKVPKIYLLNEIIFNMKVRRFAIELHPNIINSHAIWGFWFNFYKKISGQKIIHTYHGSTYYFYKNHLKRFNLKKIIYYPLLLFAHFIEKPPWKKADKIICVSEHVKKELESLYGKRKNIEVIRTGVDSRKFKLRNKKSVRKKLNLEEEGIYGLYVGRGGYWTKGLDKVINLSKKIYSLNKDYRLIVIGADKEKVKHLLKEEFIILLPPQSRKKMVYYYNASDIFFSMSRYEGGAPTMVTSEAMASGCLIVTDKQANQEIVEDRKNGLLIDKNYEKEAKRVLKFVKNEVRLKKIIKRSLRIAEDLSLKKWRRRYLKILNN